MDGFVVGWREYVITLVFLRNCGSSVAQTLYCLDKDINTVSAIFFFCPLQIIFHKEDCY
jgi:hypothetical protein